MRWFLFFVLASVAGLYGWGWFQKDTYETTIEIAASPEQVWAVLTDFDAYPEWNSFITEVDGTAAVGERLAVFIKPVHQDAGMHFTPNVLVAAPPEEFRWKGKLLFPGLMDGEHYFLIEATAQGARLTHGETFSGVLNIFVDMSPITQSYALMNEELKARAEAIRSVE